MTQPRTITIYTDGACKINPGVGSFAAILEDGTKRLCYANSQLMTTNQEMELTAAAKGLALIKGEGAIVHLVTDSQYLSRGINEWRVNWKRNGWKGSNKKTIKHVAIWQKLDTLLLRHAVTCEWVRGHSGHAGNEAADALANRAIREGRIVEQYSMT